MGFPCFSRLIPVLLPCFYRVAPVFAWYRTPEPDMEARQKHLAHCVFLSALYSFLPFGLKTPSAKLTSMLY